MSQPCYLKSAKGGSVSWDSAISGPKFCANSSTTSASTGTSSTTIILGGCEYPNWIGDDFCDDQNNNEDCEWDGGDCCGSNVNTEYCDDCDCVDPNANSGCKSQ